MPSSPNLDALLRPRSIALVGVSRDPGRQATMNGSTVLASLQRFGYAGRIDIVHPSGQPVDGRPSFVSLAALPQAADAVVLALPAASVPDLVAQAGQRGIRGAVVLSAGFSELGDEDGRRLGRQLDEAAAAHDVRLCGPNGLGYLNVWDRVLAGYFPCLLSDAVPRPGGLSIVTQSGAVGNSLLARAMDRQVGTSFVISSGNEANVSLADYVDFLVDDPRTRIIALYLEGTVDGTRLRHSLARATAAGKPVVVYKVGKSSSGARAALSHTAQVAGEPALYRGLFRQLGVVEAQRLDELIEIPMLWLKAGGDAGAPPPSGVGVVSISGGLGAIVADHLAAEGFELPELSPATRSRLEALPVKLGSTANPVDTTAAIQRTEQTLSEILEIVAADERIDALVFPNAARFPGPALNVANLMSAAAQRLRKPLLSVWYAGADNAAAMAALHASGHVACFDDPSACARALAALRDFRRFAARAPEDPVPVPPGAGGPAAHAAHQGALDEAACKALLGRYGVAVPRERLATGAAQAAEAARALGGPVAMKIVSADVPHKARVGGVMLGLQPADVPDAHARMLERVAACVPQARIDGVLVSEMLPVKLELLVGACRDPQFGPVLVVGLGGGQVEQRPDIAMRVLPVTPRDCRDVLDELQDRRVALLDEAEKAALAGAIARVAAMAWDLRSRVAEIDVNPIALTGRGDAVALDAWMTWTDTPEDVR